VSLFATFSALQSVQSTPEQGRAYTANIIQISQ
jgi:hypothetical protein